VKGSPALDLPLGGYRYPKGGEKLINIQDLQEALGSESGMKIYDYTNREVQTFLIRYTQELEKISFKSDEYEFDQPAIDEVKKTFEIPGIDEICDSMDIQFTEKVDDFEEYTITIPADTRFPVPVSVAEGDGERIVDDQIDPSFKSAVITGYVDITPKTAGTDFTEIDLTEVQLFLDDNEGISCTSSSALGTYRYELPPEGVTVYPDTEARLAGGAYVKMNKPYTLGEEISVGVTVAPGISLIEATMAVAETREEKIIDLPFPPGVKYISFAEIGALLDIEVSDDVADCSIDGLKFRADLDFYTTDAETLETAANPDQYFVFNVSTESSSSLSTGFSGGDDIFVGWRPLELPPAGYTLTGVKSAKITVTVNPAEDNGDERELTVRGIDEDSTITIQAGGTSTFKIARVKLDLNEFVTEEQRAARFPEEGKEGLNFDDFIGDLGENIDIEALAFDTIDFNVYLNGLGNDIWNTAPRLFLTAVDEAEGGSLFDITEAGGELVGAGFGGIDDIVLTGFNDERWEFSGDSPPPTGHFRTSKLAKILSAKPKDLHIDYAFSFDEPFTFTFPEDYLTNPDPFTIEKTITAELLIEVPLSLRLYAKGGADYGALTYKFFKDDDEQKDLLGREEETDDSFSDYTKYLEFASVEVEYENTFGLDGVSLVLTDGDFTKELGPLVERERAVIDLTLRGDEIPPTPFIPWVEVRIKAGEPPDEDGKCYGLIALNRGTAVDPAAVDIISIRVKAKTYINEEFSLKELSF
jgi:hypothetical protein